jgi:hypothetical protein
MHAVVALRALVHGRLLAPLVYAQSCTVQPCAVLQATQAGSLTCTVRGYGTTNPYVYVAGCSRVAEVNLRG